MSVNWWISQFFALIGLIFVVISYQKDDSKKILLYRLVATISVFIGVLFLGNSSAIVLLIVGLSRSFVTLYFAYKPKTKREVKIIASVILAAVLITLNIVFWKNYTSLVSIILGLLYILAFIQTKPKNIRGLSIIAEGVGIVYYALIISPVNVCIGIFSFISVLIGIIRFDIKKISNK